MINTLKIFTAALIFLITANTAQAAVPTYQIYTAEGKLKGIETIAGLVKDYDVVVFGEYHDNTVLHQLKLRVLNAAFQTEPKLAVSLEMFERDTQRMLNEYLKGEISEKYFLENSRPWKNYREDYRPLVEFAKNYALPVLAANIPRHVAAQYAKEGVLDNIAPDLKIYLPKIHLVTKERYWREFEAVMKNNVNGKMPVSADKIGDYYQAQCLKDDTMAESIAEFAEKQPAYTIIHYQGDFHSRYHLGVVEKLKLIAPHLKVAVIAPLYTESFSDIPKLLKENRGVADVVIFLKQGKK